MTQHTPIRVLAFAFLYFQSMFKLSVKSEANDRFVMMQSHFVFFKFALIIFLFYLHFHFYLYLHFFISICIFICIIYKHLYLLSPACQRQRLVTDLSQKSDTKEPKTEDLKLKSQTICLLTNLCG